MQNKPNFLSAKTTATFIAAKVYANKPPLPHSGKQTQSNPIPTPAPKSQPLIFKQISNLRVEFAHELPQLSTDTFDLLHMLLC
jgi:hypothetical protein